MSCDGDGMKWGGVGWGGVSGLVSLVWTNLVWSAVGCRIEQKVLHLRHRTLRVRPARRVRIRVRRPHQERPQHVEAGGTRCTCESRTMITSPVASHMSSARRKFSAVHGSLFAPPSVSDRLASRVVWKEMRKPSCHEQAAIPYASPRCVPLMPWYGAACSSYGIPKRTR
eukprot:650561-Rhodomonas_salina.12